MVILSVFALPGFCLFLTLGKSMMTICTLLISPNRPALGLTKSRFSFGGLKGEQAPTMSIAIEYEGFSTYKTRCFVPLTEELVIASMRDRFPLPAKVTLEVYEQDFSCWCAPDWDNIPSFPRFRALQRKPEKTAVSESASSDASTSKGPTQVVPENLEVTARGRNRYSEKQDKATKNYRFSVPWEDLPLKTLINLRMAELKQFPANPLDIEELKKAITTKIKASYIAHKLNTGATQRTPGLPVYEDVADEVKERFPESLKITANNRELESGRDRFLHSFKTAVVENALRHTKEATKEMMTASIAKGTVGVLPQRYNPSLNEKEEEDALKEKDILKKIHEQRKSSWNIHTIRQSMHVTYGLQRQDIVKAVQKIKNLEAVGEEEEPDDINQNAETELENLRGEWPFLFYLEYQTSHFLQLTGELIDLPLRDFCSNHLEETITFLTNQGIVKNSAIRTVWEQNGRSESVKFLVFLMMLANHFSEDCDQFIKCAEKTTLSFEVMSLPQMTGGPCLIALDDNRYLAKKFYCCIDKVVIMEADTSEEAFLGLMQAMFVFDCSYPELPHTMEYLERVVCALASKNSRQSQVMTATVAKFVSKCKSFTDLLKALVLKEQNTL